MTERGEAVVRDSARLFVNCPRGHGALRWDGEDTTCIVCGYVHYTVEDQTKLRYQLWLDEIRSETGRRLRPAKPPGA